MGRKRKPITLGVDLGGTKVDVAVVDGAGGIIFSRRYSTNPQKGPDGVIADITTYVKDCLGKTSEDILALGIGVAGQVEPSAGNVRFAPNLRWQNVPLKNELEKGIGLPVIVTNDVRAATYGEWLYGAGHGVDDLVAIFVGTGIGGGVISGGRMLEGCSNTAGEIGHITIRTDGRRCNCGNMGCLEAYAGGWAIAERVKEAVKCNAESGLYLLKLAGGVENITAVALNKAYQDKDPLACQLVEETGKYLSAGIVSIVNAFNPCLIILGGGVIENLTIFISMAEQGVKKHALKAASTHLKIVKAGLGEKAAVIGAAAMARGLITPLSFL